MVKKKKNIWTARPQALEAGWEKEGEERKAQRGLSVEKKKKKKKEGV